MIQSIQNLRSRANKRLVLLGLALALIGSGIGSAAILSDTISDQWTLNVASIDLKLNDADANLVFTGTFTDAASTA